MGIQSITAGELVDGAIEFVAGCVDNRVGPMQHLDISNGEGTAEFDAMMYRSNPELYWRLKTDRLRLNHVDSDLFVSAYDRRASLLGVPGYRVTIADLVARIVAFIVCIRACS